jgi:hypothetical protein
MSPGACRDWGYCRQRNIDAGGMKNVTPAMQAEWKKEDTPDPERRPCRYCGPGVRTGLPGNACENCMNTGYEQ